MRPQGGYDVLVPGSHLHPALGPSALLTVEAASAEEVQLLRRKQLAIAADDLETALHCKNALDTLWARHDFVSVQQAALASRTVARL